MKIVIMASGAGSTAANILENVKHGYLQSYGIEVTALICNVEGAGVLKVGQDYGVPTMCIPHGQFKSRRAFDYVIAEAIEGFGADLVVFAGWMRIVTGLFVDRFPNRIINIHPSLLPSFKGHNAVQQALDFGVKFTGCTAHLVVEDVDAGHILEQNAVPIMDGDTVETLHNRIKFAEQLCMLRAIARWHDVYYPNLEETNV